MTSPDTEVHTTDVKIHLSYLKVSHYLSVLCPEVFQEN